MARGAATEAAFDEPAMARVQERIAATVARRRVPLGFLFGAVVLGLAQPSGRSIAAGMSVAAAGESLRVWAAGHLQKGREVTSSGPYRWTGHPLYVGSSIMGAGLAIACGSVAVAVLIAVYLAMTMTAAIRTEESFLRRNFGERYDSYRRGSSSPEPARRFTLRQAIVNREYRAILGLLAATMLLLAKATIWHALDRR